MKIDPNNHIPIYLQIAEGIRSAVAAGVYRPGESLPSLRVLAIDVHVNPNTVQRAYDELEREGLIHSRRGVGLFVTERGAQSAQDQAEQTVRETFLQGIRTGQAAAMPSERIRDVFEDALNGGANPGRRNP